jgi:hypothetical protein
LKEQQAIFEIKNDTISNTNCIYFLDQLKNKYAMVNADTT